MINFEQYQEGLDALYVCAISRLMMEAKDLGVIADCYVALRDHGLDLESAQIARNDFAMMPEVSPEEALEAVVAEMLRMSTAHKVGA